MARLSVTNTRHDAVRIDMEDLQEWASEYDRFVLGIYQNQKLINTQTFTNSGDYPGWYFDFTSDYLGNNWFTPGTTYTIRCDCYYNGVSYPVGPVTFTTDSISPPSGADIAPRAYPTVRDQGPAGNCVAMALETAMEYFHASQGGIQENYSISYIYGQDSSNEEWMINEDAVISCYRHGSPRWELVTTQFPDNLTKAASKSLYAGACSLAERNASNQAFSDYDHIDFYDTAEMARVLRNGGCIFFSFREPSNFSSTPKTGIVPQPTGSSLGGHSMAIIGLTTINGKKHWIAQNSWGPSSGKNGIHFIPYDWGCGVQTWASSGNTGPTSWTQDCYALWNTDLATSNPAPPSGITASQVGMTQDATVSWAYGTSGSSSLIFARKRGTDDWWPKPSWGTLFSGTAGRLSFDKDTTVYELKLIAVKNDLLSAPSDIVTVSISLFERFSWTYMGLNDAGTPVSGTTKKSGYGVYVTASEWNKLVGLVNSVKGVSISGVSRGAPISAATVNKVASALGVRQVSAGDEMTAAFFNSLRTAYNALE